MRGGGSQSTQNKWNHINQLMRDRKIGILALQETHLTQTDLESFKRKFGDKLIIINSSDRFSPNAMGVAIIINRRIV
jgi:exonuclease III